MEANPDVLKYADISQHIMDISISPIPYEFPIVPYDKAVDQGLKVWLTEISLRSTIMTVLWITLSIGTGFHRKYLTNAHVNAVCWWTGARYTDTNEGLIKLEQGNFQTKRFYTYGLRKVGSKQILQPTSLSLLPKKCYDPIRNREICTVAVNKSKEPMTPSTSERRQTNSGDEKGLHHRCRIEPKESTITKDAIKHVPVFRYERGNLCRLDSIKNNAYEISAICKINTRHVACCRECFRSLHNRQIHYPDWRETIDGWAKQIGRRMYSFFPNGRKCLTRFSRLTDYMSTSLRERFFLTTPPVSFKQTLPLLPTPVYTWLSTPK